VEGGPKLFNNRLIFQSVSELRMRKKTNEKEKDEKMSKSNVRYQESACVMIHRLL